MQAGSNTISLIGVSRVIVRIILRVFKDFRLMAVPGAFRHLQHLHPTVKARLAACRSCQTANKGASREASSSDTFFIFLKSIGSRLGVYKEYCRNIDMTQVFDHLKSLWLRLGVQLRSLLWLQAKVSNCKAAEIEHLRWLWNIKLWDWPQNMLILSHLSIHWGAKITKSPNLQNSKEVRWPNQQISRIHWPMSR